MIANQRRSRKRRLLLAAHHLRVSAAAVPATGDATASMPDPSLASGVAPVPPR